MTRPYRIYSQKINHSSDKIIANLGYSFGFKDSKLITHWNELIGGEISSMIRPVFIKYNPKKNEHILGLLVVDLSIWGYWKMLEPVVIGKIKSAFAYDKLRTEIVMNDGKF